MNNIFIHFLVHYQKKKKIISSKCILRSFELMVCRSFYKGLCSTAKFIVVPRFNKQKVLTVEEEILPEPIKKVRFVWQGRKDVFHLLVLPIAYVFVSFQYILSTSVLIQILRCYVIGSIKYVGILFVKYLHYLIKLISCSENK